MSNNTYERIHTVIVAARKLVDDKTASIAPELFGRLKQVDPNSGEEIPLVEAGTRVKWHGILKRAAVDLWDIPKNNPDNAPNLWEDILYRLGYRIIPKHITVGLAFDKGECGWGEDGLLYRSKVATNVHTPEEYPDNWELALED